MKHLIVKSVFLSMRYFLSLCFLLLLVNTIQAQQGPLPKYMTPAEEAQMPTYLTNTIKSALRAPALPDNPRAPAEWEELQGITISWSNSFWEIQAEIVRHASKEVTVYINTTNESQVKSRLDQVGVDHSSNVEFINTNYNSLWIRDYGPNSVYINDVDSLIFIDWIYNRPRPLDDQIPQAVGNHLNIPIIEMANQPYDLVHTGGNFMSNGNGQGFSSNLVLDENGPNNNWGISNHSESVIDDIMQDFMGIDEYIKMTNLPFDAIHHIDMHMKMIDEETIILGKYPEGIADGPQIEANLQFILENFRTTFNRKFNIIRIPMPPDDNGRYPHQNGDYRTYANAMFVNKTVLLPIYEEQYDSTAIKIWQNALPGHTIAGIDCNDIIPLSGALHCIIKEIAVDDPIWIMHKPIIDPFVGDQDEFKVEAQIKHKADLDEVWLHYSVDGRIENDSTLMTNDGNYMWSAFLPDSYFSEYTYYIKAISSSGKIIEKPLAGSVGGAWKFNTMVVGANDIKANHIQVDAAYPNPATSITAIPVSTSANHNLTAALSTIDGKQVDVIYDNTYGAHQKHLFFDANNYSSGMYIISIQSKNDLFTQKIVIK